MSQGFRNRYPTYNVLDKWDTPSWNDQTRAVVAKRLHEVPPRRFFSEAEWDLLQAICDRLIPQPDRPGDPVPIVPFIDEKLHENQGDGYRYESLPPQRDAWRIGLRAIDEEARAHWQRGFRELPDNLKDAVLRSVQHGDTLERSVAGHAGQAVFQERAAARGRSASITRTRRHGARSASAGRPRRAAMSGCRRTGATRGTRSEEKGEDER